MGYDAETIEVLPGLEAVRRRPSMYVGALDSTVTLSHLVEQVMCTSLDEAISGRCNRIAVTLHGDDSVTVEDDGPGMRVDVHNGMSYVEAIMSHLHACRAARENAYAKQFCGYGIQVVNALSEIMSVE